MKVKIVILLLALFVIMIISAFGRPITNELVDRLGGGSATCTGGLCSTCIINESPCDCGPDSCDCGGSMVERERCMLLGGDR